ncbi:MAG: imidazolonepropionase-like amidohydrolase [Planctomycetota bacterium]|jgi:imidazolonepropionase-like amidohydrolase
MLEPDEREQLQYLLRALFLRWGMVNVVDTGVDLDLLSGLKKLINNNQVKGPQILAMGSSFVGKGGSPFYIKPVHLPEFSSTEQAAKATAGVLKAGADGIKLFTGSWATPERVVVMQLDYVKAAATVAHQAGALVFAHPSDSEGAAIAIAGGVDVLAHSFPAELKAPGLASLSCFCR